jgi:thiosulfate dehydrogenase (quinone) large subunit
MREKLMKLGLGSRLFVTSLLVLRILLGGLFLLSGLTKLASGTFSAAGLLGKSVGPFTSFYVGLANNTSVLPVINYLVMWGEALIGIALILGLLVRFASFWGIVQMILYYTVTLPTSTGWISQQIIYIAVFLILMFSGIGYYLGLDRFSIKLEESKHPLRLLFG